MVLFLRVVVPNIVDSKIDGVISRATLEAEIGGSFASCALSRMKRGGAILIPNYERLERGDVILSKHCLSDTNIKNTPVQIAQLSLASKRFSEDACSWGHAMVYVGNMFIAESQPFFFSGITPKSGLRALPLTIYSLSRELIICRHKELCSTLGEKIAHYATLNCIADTRRYPLLRTIKSALLDKSLKKELLKAANCSEFALECLAIGGGYMVEPYSKLDDGEAEFYPADFFTRQEFDKIPMSYLKVEG